MIFAPDGRIVAGTSNGVILVGSPDAEPHLLLGHRGMVQGLRMMPDGRLVSASHDKTVRNWPLPDPSEPPLHALPYGELMARLREVTNLRMVKDETSFAGYRMTIESFEGWRDLPAW